MSWINVKESGLRPVRQVPLLIHDPSSLSWKRVFQAQSAKLSGGLFSLELGGRTLRMAYLGHSPQIGALRMDLH